MRRGARIGTASVAGALATAVLAGAPAPGSGSDEGPRSGPAKTKMRAGAATAEITPPVGTPMFAYTARSRLVPEPDDPTNPLQIVADPDQNLYAKSFEPSEGIHTRLRASAIVIERGGEKVALVQADLGGLPYALVQAVVQRLGSASGFSTENLVISATHTHSATGPIWPADNLGYQALGGDFFDPRVFGLTADGIAEAILEAERRLEPAVVGLGTSRLEGASSNRAFGAFQRNQDVPADLQEELKLDRTVTVIRVDAAEGEPIGLWSNFAVHQTSFGAGNLLLSGDNAATTERLVEREVALESEQPAPDPGAPGESDGPVLVWTNGAEGDVSPDGSPRNPDGDPLDYVGSSDFADANMAGIKVADGILAAWRDADDSLKRNLRLGAVQTFRLFDGDQVANGDEAGPKPVGPLAVLGAGVADFEPRPCLPEGTEAIPGQGRKVPLLVGAGLVPQTAPISLVRIGDTALVSMPFEITTQMGRRIGSAAVEASRGELDPAVIAGLSNGYLSYTSTPEEYDHCGYEGSFTLFGRHQGPLLRETAESLVPALVESRPAPASDPEPPPLGFDSPDPANPQPTPDPETAVAQPQDTSRFGRASFTWNGGDPSVEAPRGRTFVALQHRDGGEWETIGVDDGPESTTLYDDEARTWTETWQFSNCEPLGTYRFVVTGRAVKSPGGAPEEYRAVSEQFELGPMPPLGIIDAVVADGIARVRARYPAPAGDPLLALPRRVRSGEAQIVLTGGSEVVARPDEERLAFEAAVPAGAGIERVSVTDACGNSTG